MTNITAAQAATITETLHAFALANGATAAELLASKNALGEGRALSRHIDRVTSALKCSYQALSAATQNVLECCRYVAGALAFSVEPHQFGELDQRVWRVAMSAI